MKNYLLLIGLILCTISANALKIQNLSELKVDRADDDEYWLQITEIDLSNKGLMTFPEEILKCKNLRVLRLSENGLINLPAALGNLTKLEELDLSRNQGLSFLDLGIIFKGAFFRLDKLNLENCEMGHLPTEIGMQSSLKDLNVSGNLLNNLPYSITRLSKMETLDASNNRIEDITWQVHQWWALKRLDISNNQEMKTEELIFALSTLDHLDYLAVSHLTHLPKEAKDLNVDELVISDSKIDRFLRVPTSSKINKLAFISCEFKDAEKVAEVVEEFVQPDFLRLNNIQTSDLFYFMKMRCDIDSVDIRSNNLRNIQPLFRIPGLKWIDARANTLDDGSKSSITNHPEITVLVSEPIKKMTGINPPIPKFAPKPQEKLVQAGEASQVAMGNAVFRFKENSFVDENGSVYRGDANLSYTEYRNPAEILFSGITMTVEDGDETVAFSSAGMFNLTATDDKGNELAVNPSAPIEVEMLRNNADTAVSLYVLNDEGVWEYQGKDKIAEPFKLDMAKIDSAGNAAFLNFKEDKIIITSNRFVPRIEMDSRNKSFALNFKELRTNSGYRDVHFRDERCYIKSPGNAATLIANTTFYYDGDRDSLKYYKSFFKRVQRQSRNKYRRFSSNKVFSLRGKKYDWGLSYINEMDVLHDKENDRLTLQFYYKDSLVNVPVVLRSDPKNQKNRIKVFSRFAENLAIVKREDEKERVELTKIAAKIITDRRDQIQQLARQREERRQMALRYDQDQMNSVASGGSVSSAFRISGFGVWNCDQLARMRRPMPLPLSLVDEKHEEIHADIEYVFIVDHELNGVFSYGSNLESAYYDADSKKVSIVILFGGFVMGVYHSWKDAIQNAINGEEDKPKRDLEKTLRLQQFNYSNMTAETAMNLVLE